eukprot:15485526-Alexandrium_andersonii.AAC.1
MRCLAESIVLKVPGPGSRTPNPDPSKCSKRSATRQHGPSSVRRTDPGGFGCSPEISQSP